MPMNWTTEATAKASCFPRIPPPTIQKPTKQPLTHSQLFLGVLDQLKEQNIKLSYQKLAEYMGPECNRKAIDNQMVKLRKQASQGPGNDHQSTAPSVPSPSTPVAAPKKRRANTTPSKMVTPSKKVKQQQLDSDGDGDGDSDDDEVERRILNEVKEELKRFE
ncbi:hypothetical protein BDW59DRAFT_166123 [Aspergillus cavernicola]|uniref:Uncharacterized protein n=1 Tax=Aspergillus cavernicola TaxID=176166 RepID=A0ABR4HND6_9EURO